MLQVLRPSCPRRLWPRRLRQALVAKQVGVGASIGAAIGKNNIGYDIDGTAQKTTQTIYATISNSDITSGGAVIPDRNCSRQTINTVMYLPARSAIAGERGTMPGLGFSGSGVLAENKIGVDVTGLYQCR